MQNIIEKLEQMFIVPLVVINDVSKAVPLAKALCNGGLPCAEIAFRTSEAAEAINAITSTMPEMLVGAGTILSPAQVDEALSVGAKFIVSPGLNPDVVRYCQSKGVPVFPGVCTPTEIEQGLALGLNMLKFFPAEAAGGINMLKAVAGPYRNVRFMPSGGITQKNLPDYRAVKSVFACSGSWMVKDELIAAGDFDKITELTKEAVSLLK